SAAFGFACQARLVQMVDDARSRCEWMLEGQHGAGLIT
ncbi:MAG: hypothetical protein RLY20_305, partial [Verrucomicrobiota bacterium]